MPVSDPATCRDRSNDWLKYFYRRRGKDILAMINDGIIAEHQENADEHLGAHSPTLHLILNYFRAQPVVGKEFVYAAKPYTEYRLGTIAERGSAPRLLATPAFATEREAMHATFLIRVERLQALVEAGGP